jgi:hypothetical protein
MHISNPEFRSHAVALIARDHLVQFTTTRKVREEPKVYAGTAVVVTETGVTFQDNT